MIDDRQTCDVCGEEFNQDRPHAKHVTVNTKNPSATVKPGVLTEKNGSEDTQSV